MLYANVGENKYVEAFKGGVGNCPTCNADVIAKVGPINIPHWAHKYTGDCDSFSEPETLWHKKWKERFPLENREVVLGCHRADVLINNRVIEFQNSNLCSSEIAKREMYYNSKTNGLIWVLNGMDFLFHFRIQKQYSRNTFSFHWKWPRKSWLQSNSVFIDFGNTFFKQYYSFSDSELAEWLRKTYPIDTIYMAITGVDLWPELESESFELPSKANVPSIFGQGEDKNLSMSLDIDRGLFYCQRTDFEGDIFNLIAGKKNIPASEFVHILDKLKKYALKSCPGLDLPASPHDALFLIKKVYSKLPVRGWGQFFSHEEFIKKVTGPTKNNDRKKILH